MNWAWIVGGIIALQYGGYGYWYIHKRFIRPFLSYKMVIFDVDDEFVFHVKKKKAIVFEGVKGYKLFKEKEFYSIPLTNETQKSVSKRDDVGSVTYYYFKNNPNPIDIRNHDAINISNDASLMAKVMKTKILDSSLMMEKKPITINWILIGAIVLMAVAVIFHKQIGAFLGIGG